MDKTPNTIEFTEHELAAAVERYESLTQPEIEAAYAAMLAVPGFGLKLALAFQTACKDAAETRNPSRVLDAAVVPAFLIGYLVGKTLDGG